jgi:ectoine hydroxylase-related dioxygenase (phytanoyl-CoA dioxygenase family)
MHSLNQLHLTTEQKNQFQTLGFLKIPKAVNAATLEQLRTAIDLYSNSTPVNDNIASVKGANQEQYVIGIQHLCNINEAPFLALLGSPLLLSIAQQICGADFFPIQEFAVIKTLGDNSKVEWHQDVVNKLKGHTFMMGIYLDEANDANGALRVIPVSHKSELPICELKKLEYETIEMQAGDILIHDLMLAHSSGMLTQFAKRRVIYFEFMSSSQAKNEQVYTNEMIEKRTALIPLAINAYKRLNNTEESFNWQHPSRENRLNNKAVIETVESIYTTQLKVKPANYCFDFANTQ